MLKALAGLEGRHVRSVRYLYLGGTQLTSHPIEVSLDDSVGQERAYDKADPLILKEILIGQGL